MTVVRPVGGSFGGRGGGRGGDRGGRGGRGGARGGGRGGVQKGGRGGMKGGSKVAIEAHRHEGVFIARGKEDALVTKNMVRPLLFIPGSCRSQTCVVEWHISAE